MLHDGKRWVSGYGLKYPARGPLAFFADYLDACEQVPCPAPLRFSEALQKDARHLAAIWERSRIEGQSDQLR